MPHEQMLIVAGRAEQEHREAGPRTGGSDEGRASNTILLGEDRDFWVIADTEGNVLYKDAELEIGWPDEYEAEHEARGLQSRTGEQYVVRRQ